MFDLIAHKEGAKLTQNRQCLNHGAAICGESGVKRKNPAFFA